MNPKCITYQLNKNILIPFKTGVLILNDICDNIYNFILDPTIRNAIHTGEFISFKYILDDSKNNYECRQTYSFLDDQVCTTNAHQRLAQRIQRKRKNRQ